MRRISTDAALWLAGPALALALVVWFMPVALLVAAPWVAGIAWIALRHGLTREDTIPSAGSQALERSRRL